ncbi:nucleotidyl transferase AbiEii/AbiGii toxin family protein [Paenibacillus sp. WLX2291]|uniref:nucleotidyl transferase AbiEii/AbiGii toxin family protein n=1 Tax=Paenibacillus sp. WLX2291 TaxID=3296934 RepID=UPI003983EEBB
MTNFAASVIDKLKNIAKENNKAFNAISILYYQERFLTRLSMSNYKENFILKGGLYLYSVTKFKSRPTRDMDFSGRSLSNDSFTLASIVKDICKLQPNDVENDGVVFHTEQIQHEIIKEDAEYEGVRIIIPCSLGNMRERLQLDIGFGDVIIPNPQTIDYPVLLPHMSAPELLVYTNESVIAEKFEAMVSLSVANSRMKDFYDIFTLARTNSFEGSRLCHAVSATFKRRTTIINKDHIIFSKDFYNDKRRLIMWSNFIRNLKPDDSPTFQEVMECIHTFLRPIYNHVLDEQDFLSEWNHHKANWEDLQANHQ